MSIEKKEMEMKLRSRPNYKEVASISPEHFGRLADIYSRIENLLDVGMEDSDSIYLEGKIGVWSKDQYPIGYFVLEDDWWMFYLVAETDEEESQ